MKGRAETALRVLLLIGSAAAGLEEGSGFGCRVLGAQKLWKASRLERENIDHRGRGVGVSKRWEPLAPMHNWSVHLKGLQDLQPSAELGTIA